MCRVLVVALALLISTGCGPRSDVVEVSLQQSGVEVVTPTRLLSEHDWPGWRGPSRNGQAADQDLPDTWDESTNVRWRAEIPGRGHSSPIVVGETILLTTADAEADEQLVLAFNRADGTERWRTVIHRGGLPAATDQHPKSSNANATLTSDGRDVFAVFFNAGRIQATALTIDGEVKWQREIGNFTTEFGYGPSPLIYQSLLIVVADHKHGAYLAALDTGSGEVAWRVRRPDFDSYSSPTVADVGGRDQLLISGGKAVSSFDPQSGDQLWSTPATTRSTCGTVITSADRIYASGGFPDKETVCLSASGEQIWTQPTKIYEPSLVLSGEHLFGVTDDGIAYCWSASDGELRWRKRLGGNFSASPIVSGDRIYAPNLSGETFVFTASGEGYRELARNRLGNDCYASPVAVDDRLYLRVGNLPGPSRSEQLVCIAAAAD